MPYNEYISLDPAIMVSKPYIGGTRITVELIVKKLGEGATIAELLEAFHGLKKSTFMQHCNMRRLFWLTKSF